MYGEVRIDYRVFYTLISKTRGSKEPVSLTLVYVNIKQRKQIDS